MADLGAAPAVDLGAAPGPDLGAGPGTASGKGSSSSKSSSPLAAISTWSLTQSSVLEFDVASGPVAAISSSRALIPISGPLTRGACWNAFDTRPVLYLSSWACVAAARFAVICSFLLGALLERSRVGPVDPTG